MKNLPRQTLNSEYLCANHKGNHIHKRNFTKAQSTYCPSHNNSGNFQYLTLIDRQITEIETKQRHSDINRRYIRDISYKWR